MLDELRAAGEPAGIGLSGQMHGLVTLDAADEVLRPAILWNDQRTAAECAEIEERVGLDELIALTGNRALTGFTAPKLLWMRRHEPELYGRIASVLLPKDYVRLRLCGREGHRRGRRERHAAVRRRPAALVGRGASGALELDAAWLPRALESPEVSGATGGGVPVAAGAGDQAAGALGVGRGPARARRRWCSAPRAWCSPRSSEFAADPEARAHSFCHAVPGAWHAMGVMLSAAGSLRWLRDVAAPGEDFAALVAEAERVGARGRGAHLPALPGRRAHAARRPGRPRRLHRPVAAPRPRRAGARRARGRGLRAARLARPGGRRWARRPRSGRVSGGGARSDLWLRIVASVLELPLERTAVDEGAAFGAALLGGVAGGVWARRGRGGGRGGAHHRTWSSPWRSGSSPTARGASASGRSIRRSTCEPPRG